jgi:hypothetical protein
VPRPAFALLHSGRLKGQRLFAGSILTLRYFLYPFGFRLALVQTLRGMDDRDLKVAENEVVDQDVFELVQQMARAMAGSGRG